MKSQPCIVHPMPLEVVVTEHDQATVTFNVAQISVHSDIHESESD